MKLFGEGGKSDGINLGQIGGANLKSRGIEGQAGELKADPPKGEVSLVAYLPLADKCEWHLFAGHRDFLFARTAILHIITPSFAVR